MRTPQLILKPGKEKSIRQGHPWIFSGAVQSTKGQIAAGAELDVLDNKGSFLARAYYNPQSSIVARVFAKQNDVVLSRDFFIDRISAAWTRRESLRDALNTMQRVVASEADLLPGLIIDRYNDWIVFQILTLGMEVCRTKIIEAIEAVFAPAGIIERSDESIRTKEGLKERKELIKGQLSGTILGRENGIGLWVDLWEGHKTGLYLDQRNNRQIVANFASGKEVLNCFSYTGGFGAAAGKFGATRIVSVDESRPALELAHKNWQENVPQNSNAKHEIVRADVFQYLRQLREQGAQFDLIVMDPPKFVSDKHNIDRACRGYKDLNLLAMQLLRMGGYLATFSCSGLMSRDLFQKVVFGASVDAQVELQILHHLSQAEDHPVLLSFPESLYLKGFFCRKIAG